MNTAATQCIHSKPLNWRCRECEAQIQEMYPTKKENNDG